MLKDIFNVSEDCKNSSWGSNFQWKKRVCLKSVLLFDLHILTLKIICSCLLSHVQITWQIHLKTASFMCDLSETTFWIVVTQYTNKNSRQLVSCDRIQSVNRRKLIESWLNYDKLYFFYIYFTFFAHSLNWALALIKYLRWGLKIIKLYLVIKVEHVLICYLCCWGLNVTLLIINSELSTIKIDSFSFVWFSLLWIL